MADVALLAVKRKFTLLYLSKFHVFSRSAAEHINHFKHVVTLLRDAGFTLTLKKRNFFPEFIDYFGQAIRPRRL